MMSDIEMLKLLNNGNFNDLFLNINDASIDFIKSRIKEIPTEYFQPRIMIDEKGNKCISLIQFSTEVAGMPSEKRKGLMEKYHINPFDMKKLQGIIDSIKVAYEYGTLEDKVENENKNESYGFSLASDEKLDKAYPLWLAYLFADSENPLADIKMKLKEDGMDGKYSPETIVGLIEHTNGLMQGRSQEEKKDFYVKSINGILEGNIDRVKGKDMAEIHI